MGTQDDVIGFLAEGASYGSPGAAVERHDTHISIVFLVGDRAYKLKRAVRLPYVDFSTLARRERFCRAELALNRRTAPSLYLGVRAVRRRPDGKLGFDGEGVVEDWVLEMRRFDPAGLFDHLATAGGLTPDLMRALTDEIAAFHQAAEPMAQHGGRAGLAHVIAVNHAALGDACPPLDRDAVDRLHDASIDRLAALGDLLDRRRDAGKVRRCHGDLHLRNICLFEGAPTLFDCLEFDDGLSCIDVLYDVAFLVMDLAHRGLTELANGVLNRYLDVTTELDGLAAVPLFVSARAAVRAHVVARQADRPGRAEEARAYLALAAAALRSREPCLVAVGGLSGTGKSTLARALAATFEPVPGARVIRSDVLRKRLRGARPEARLPPAAYTLEANRQVYDELNRQAAAALAAGFPVIADAAFLRQDERAAIADGAARSGVPFVGLWLEAPPEVLVERVGARRNDASDADAAVLQGQLRIDVGRIDWHRIDMAGGVAAGSTAARDLLQATHRR